MFTCGEGGLGVPCSPAPVTGSGRSHVQPLSTELRLQLILLPTSITPMQRILPPDIHLKYWERTGPAAAEGNGRDTCSICGGRIHCCRPTLTPGDRSESCGSPVQIYLCSILYTHPHSKYKYNPSSNILFIRIDCNLEFADPCKVGAKNGHVSILEV